MQIPFSNSQKFHLQKNSPESSLQNIDAMLQQITTTARYSLSVVLLLQLLSPSEASSIFPVGVAIVLGP